MGNDMLSALRDAWLEFRIRLLTNGEMTPAKWKKFAALIKLRSERQVKRMERLRGLL